jgi:hypothetical protein
MWGASDHEDETTIGIAKKAKSTIIGWFSQFLP